MELRGENRAGSLKNIDGASGVNVEVIRRNVS